MSSNSRIGRYAAAAERSARAYVYFYFGAAAEGRTRP